LRHQITLPLPATVCVLDVETERVEFRQPEQCVLAFVGTKTFRRYNGIYQPEQYVSYLPGKEADLESFLRTFPGLIIGHNIFAFDYRTLRPRLSLTGIIEKTVDTLEFLSAKRSARLKGLSLDHLCRANVGKGKTLDGASTPDLWRQGKRDEVIAYNENDCVLTMALWEHLVFKRSLLIRYYEKDTWTEEGTITITDRDLAELLGQTPRYTYAAWNTKVETGGFTRQRQPKLEWGLADVDWAPEPEYEVAEHHHYCKTANRTYLFEERDMLGDRGDMITIPCPGCGTEEVLVLEDYTLIGSVEGDATGYSREAELDQLRLAHINATRSQWSFLPQLTDDQNPDHIKQCVICGRFLDESPIQPAQENPIDGSPICVHCLNAGRWLLTLK